MAFVLDSSVTLAWCFKDEATSYTRAVAARLQTASALVSAIWPMEVANVLLIGERRGRLSTAETQRFVQYLHGLPITVDDPSIRRALEPVLDLARAQGLTSYSASYLELAAREGLPLATLDDRLRAAAQRMGVPLVT